MTNTPEWAAEHAVSVDQAANLIAGQFPELANAPVEPLADGWDNTVFRVDGWIFRFPRRTIALPGVRREIAVLPRLAPRLPLPIPVPELVGHPSDDYPWPFWGTRPIIGVELAEAEPPPDAWVRTAAQVGAFLRALHTRQTALDLGPLLPYDPLHRGDPAIRAPMARDRLARLAGQGLWKPSTSTETLLHDGELLGPPTNRSEDQRDADPLGTPHGASGERAVVCHGDLHLRHVMVGADGGVTGVIDWGDLCLADPAVDLSLAYGAFDGAARKSFLAEYGSVPEDREVRARVLAVFLCATLAEWAAATGRERLLDVALAGLGRAAD